MTQSSHPFTNTIKCNERDNNTCLFTRILEPLEYRMQLFNNDDNAGCHDSVSPELIHMSYVIPSYFSPPRSALRSRPPPKSHPGCSQRTGFGCALLFLPALDTPHRLIPIFLLGYPRSIQQKLASTSRYESCVVYSRGWYHPSY